MAQYARPASDVNLSGWTNPTYSVISEPVASFDGVFTQSANKTDSIYIGTLSTVSDPALSTGHILRVRGYIVSSGESHLYIDLYEGPNLRVTFEPTWTGSSDTYSYTLTSGEADSITNYANLRVYLRFDYVSGSTGRAYVDCFEFEVPSISGGSYEGDTTAAKTDSLTSLSTTNLQNALTLSDTRALNAEGGKVVEETLYNPH